MIGLERGFSDEASHVYLEARDLACALVVDVSIEEGVFPACDGRAWTLVSFLGR